MNKVDAILKDLGYRLKSIYYYENEDKKPKYSYEKQIDEWHWIFIIVIDGKITNARVMSGDVFEQEDIDNIQKAFDQLKADLKILDLFLVKKESQDVC